MIQILHGLLLAATALALLGLCIFVHEFGHFIAAKYLGMIIHTFSIGFGPAIWKRKINGIVYKIGWIPIGGYVALPQLDPAGMEKIQGTADGGEQELRKLPKIAPWKKIIVSLSGAVGNVLLAIAIAWLVFWIGMPTRSSVIGYIDMESAAYEIGLRIGDRILTVDGDPTRNWSQVVEECMLTKNSSVVLQVQSPDGATKTLTVPVDIVDPGIKLIRGIDGRSICLVAGTEPGSTAETAGIRRGDVVTEFDGVRVLSRPQLVDMVQQKQGIEVAVVITRNGETIRSTVVPQYDEAMKFVRIGIQFTPMPLDFDGRGWPTPGQQLRHHATMVFRVLDSLTTRKTAKAMAGQIGGPPAIMIQYWYILKSSIMVAIWFTGLLNVNLAILNLLPIPVLDGGHILFSLYEAIVRRPLHPRVMNTLVNVFAVLLIGLLALLCYRDIVRFTPAGKYVKRLFASKAETNEAALAAPTSAVAQPDNQAGPDADTRAAP